MKLLIKKSNTKPIKYLEKNQKSSAPHYFLACPNRASRLRTRRVDSPPVNALCREARPHSTGGTRLACSILSLR